MSATLHFPTLVQTVWPRHPLTTRDLCQRSARGYLLDWISVFELDEIRIPMKKIGLPGFG
jgi:hypothetical protein